MTRPQLSIVMPVYNEVWTIGTIIERARKAPIDLSKELVIVDDASTDGTREVLKRLSAGRDDKTAPSFMT